MRRWQDDFFVHVGLKHGLARIGPARRRLTRSQWQAEQQVVRATAVCLQEKKFAQTVVDVVEARAQSVLVSEREIKAQKKALVASKVELQSEQKKWQRYGHKLGVFWGR